MGAYSRGGLTRRGRARFAAHLASCERCTSLLAEIEDAGGRLAVLLLPLLIGGSAAAELLERTGAEAGSPRDAAPGGTTHAAAPGRPALVTIGGVVASVLVVAAVATAVAVSSQPEPPRHPTSAPPAAGPTAEAPTPSPTPTPTVESPEPELPVVPPRVVPPPAVVPSPPPAVAPAAPAAPTVDFDPATGRLAVTGSGDSPGATIEVWGTTTSIVTGITSPATLLASTVVAPDGSWATPDAGGITPVNVTVVVTQKRAGLSSPPVEVVTDAIFGVVAVSNAGTVTAGSATWHLLGWPGAAWEIREPAGGPTVASGVFAADGTAVATVALPSAPSGTTFAYDYGYVQDGALAASAPGLTADVP